MPQPSLPRFAGFGLGMRTEHYDAYLSGTAPVDFVEIISENFMGEGGRPLHLLERVRQNYPVAMHGVSMSIGSADGLRADYLARLKRLADRIEPLWVSDHLCWTGVDGFNSHDLLPLPYTREALEIAEVADAGDAGAQRGQRDSEESERLRRGVRQVVGQQLGVDIDEGERQQGPAGVGGRGGGGARRAGIAHQNGQMNGTQNTATARKSSSSGRPSFQ